MIIRSVRHRGLKRLIEDNQTRGIQSDLVNRIRNVLTALILAEHMGGFRASAPPGWRVLNCQAIGKTHGACRRWGIGGLPLKKRMDI